MDTRSLIQCLAEVHCGGCVFAQSARVVFQVPAQTVRRGGKRRCQRRLPEQKRPDKPECDQEYSRHSTHSEAGRIHLPSSYLAVQSPPQLSLLLQHLQLKPLDTVTKRFLALPDGARAQLVLRAEQSTLLPRRGRRAGLGLFHAALLQVRPGFERFYAALLTLRLRVGAREQKRNVRTNLISQGRLCCRQFWLRDKLIVLFSNALAIEEMGKKFDR